MKKHFLVFLTVGALIFTSSGLALAQEGLGQKKMFENLKGIGESFKQLKQASDSSSPSGKIALEEVGRLRGQTGHILLKGADQLKRILERIQGDERLTEQEKSRLTKEIQEALNEINQVKEKLALGKDEEAIRGLQQMFQEKKGRQALMPKANLTFAVSRLESLLTKIKGLTPKVQSLINELKSQGKDTKELQENLDSINERLNTVETTLSGVKTKLESINSQTQDPQAVLTEVRKELAKVRAEFAKIRHDIAQLRGTFRITLNHGSEATPSASFREKVEESAN
jgi:chromosome segregation ATPase